MRTHIEQFSYQLMTCHIYRGDFLDTFFLESTLVDEGMFQLGLKAAAARLDFLPCIAGLGTDVLKHNPEIKVIQSPYSSDNYVAMPAIKLDVALCHVTEADNLGNSFISGPDVFFDEWFCRAADKSYLTA